MNAFSPNYVSQIKTDDITRARKLSESNTKSLNERRQSDDPYVKAMALGTIDGLSKKSDAQIQAKTVISPLRNGKKLTQPPKNARTVLDHGESSMKSAKLSRGRAI